MKRLLLLAALFPVQASAVCFIKADTADNNFALGPFVDSTDGVTAETGLTVADGDILVKQPDSTTYAEETGFSDCTHRSEGNYTCPYDATVFDTEGMIEISVQVTGAAPVFDDVLRDGL